MTQNLIRIFSHNRSGTHFLIETLKKNFDVNLGKHRHYLNSINEKNCTFIYIVRDVRDVMVSCYIHLKYAKGYKWYNWIRKYNYENITFDDFLKGKLGKLPPINKKQRLFWRDPILYWSKHTKAWDILDIKIRYEDLINKPLKTLNYLSISLDLPLKNSEPRIIKNLVGRGGYRGQENSWVNFFSYKNLKMVEKKAGKRMIELGYKI